MDKYKVKVTPRAALDIDNIYCYIADEFKDIGSAENHADELENAILSLDTVLYRGAERKTGAFANNVKQPLIARMEKAVHSPQIDSLLKVLVPLGYKLQIVPMEKKA